MESETEAAIGGIQDFSAESPEQRITESFIEEERVLEEFYTDELKDDVFNLNVSLAILESETAEVDSEFHDALEEIEGKKSFPCPNCDKVCKSKGGLTKHTNAKHREKPADLPSSLPTESDMSLDSLNGIIEAIKTNLITEDLYGAEINKFIKNASCSEALFNAVFPLYTKFCRKKNQDKLLETFYGLLPNASEYLNCTNSNAASIIMIEIPDHLVGHFKVCQERELAKTKPTISTSDIKLDPSERGPLSYVAGYIVSKLYQKSRNTKAKPDEGLQELLRSLKSTETDNSFIQARSRGGLVTPSDNLMGIMEEAEICFRKTVGEDELVLRNIPTEMICESTLSSPVVKSLWENIVLESGTNETSPTQKLCLENIVKLYVRVRSFSYARDYISKYKIKEKQTKSKSLRKDLKRSKND
jgi:hypothetical protein